MPTSARPSRRTASTAVLAVALAGALSGCGGGEDPEPSAEAPTVVAPSLPSVADGVSQSGVPLLVNLTVVDGKVSGAVGTVRLAVNTPVRVTVVTDTSDTLLVTGYDVRAQLTVDEPVQLAFIASRTGTFEVRLEDAGQVLTRLDVR